MDEVPHLSIYSTPWPTGLVNEKKKALLVNEKNEKKNTDGREWNVKSWK